MIEGFGGNGKVLVLGLGNPLMGDDGAGIEALGLFRETYGVPPGAEIVDGGTLGLHLLDRFDGCSRVLVADAVTCGARPGDVVRLEGEDLDAVFSRCVSPHELGFNDVFAALTLLGRAPERLVVLGIEPARVALGIGLSEPARRALPRLVEAMAEELRSWGVPVEPLAAASRSVGRTDCAPQDALPRTG